MSRISEIYDSVYQDEYIKEIDKFLAIIEPEIRSIIKAELSGNDDRYKATRLIADYALNLSKKGQWKKALPYLGRAIYLFETDEKLTGQDLLNEPVYESLIWMRGEIYFYLKKYSLAKQDFKRLHTKWPENERFKNWYNACVSRNATRVQWAAASLLLIYFIARYMLGIESDLLFWVNLVGVFCFSASVISELMMRIK